MRTMAVLVACAAALLHAAPAAPSDSSSREPCAGLPLQSLLSEAAPRSFVASAKGTPGYVHTGEIADKALCSSIFEPLTVLPDESPGFADRFCGLFRAELSRGGDRAKEAILGGPDPGEPLPGFGSCDFFAQDGATTISARAVYILQPDQSTKLLVMVSAW